jgi:hypothetical protein
MNMKYDKNLFTDMCLDIAQAISNKINADMMYFNWKRERGFLGDWYDFESAKHGA